MAKLLLAMKKDIFNSAVKPKIKGEIFFYWTNRKIVFPKDAEVYIRVQGDNYVMAICKYLRTTKSSKYPNYKYDIQLKVVSKVAISTKEIYDDYNIKAGAEWGWLEK